MPKPHFHFRSQDGSAVPLAYHLQRLGYPVTLYVKSPEAKDMAKGMLTRVAVPPPGAVIIYDCTGMGSEAQKFRSQGFPVIGGNPFDKTLELDRPAGARIMQKAGIKTPETYPFSTTKQAIAFLEKQEGAWFVKVSGDNVECSTYDAQNPDEMIRYLEYVQASGPVKPFELQRKVKGTEISTNGWFDGTRFIEPFDLTIEEKHFLDGDVGPRTGCESCIVWHSRKSKLPSLVLEPIASVLEKEGYVGPIDLNALVNSDGVPLGLEWTARLGFDSTQSWMHLFGEDLGEQLEAFSVGALDEWEPAIEVPAMTLRLSIPPYPTWEPKLIAKSKGIPLDDLVMIEPFDPVDVMLSDNGPEAAGASGIIGTVHAEHETLNESRSAIHKFIHHIAIPNVQHRQNIVVRAERDLAELERLGMK